MSRPQPDASHGRSVVVKPEDASRFIQWFEVVQDLNEPYLERGDYDLAARLYVAAGRRVPASVRYKLESK